MKSKKQMKEWILKNCVDEYGDIDISGLDFSDFNGEIFRGKWKVKSNLFQDCNEVDGNLYNNWNKVGRDLWEDNNKVKGNTYTDFKHHNKVMKLVECEEYEWVEDKRFAKQIEDITKKELIKMIKELIK